MRTRTQPCSPVARYATICGEQSESTVSAEAARHDRTKASAQPVRPARAARQRVRKRRDREEGRSRGRTLERESERDRASLANRPPRGTSKKGCTRVARHFPRVSHSASAPPSPAGAPRPAACALALARGQRAARARLTLRTRTRRGHLRAARTAVRRPSPSSLEPAVVPAALVLAAAALRCSTQHG
jgi:hypothetical protein